MEAYLTGVPSAKRETFLDYKRQKRLCWQEQGVYIGTITLRAATESPFSKDRQALLIAIYNSGEGILRSVKQELTDSLDCNIVVKRISFNEVNDLVLDGKRILAECAYVEQRYDNLIHKEPDVLKKAEEKQPVIDTVDNNWDAIVGCHEAKEVAEQLIANAVINRELTSRGVPYRRVMMPLFFEGEPGSNKTSFAKLLAQRLKQEGVLSKGNFVPVGRDAFVGEYVGHTAPKTRKLIEDNLGNLLFVDEAYSLCPSETGGNDFAKEAVAALIDEMEKHRNEIAIVFAGYPGEMEKLISCNPGLKSRIAYRVYFPNYTCSELISIYHLFADKDGVILDKGVDEKLRLLFEKAMRSGNFGNGRFVRTAYEKSLLCKDMRLYRKDLTKYSDREILTILPQDIPKLREGLYEKRRDQ